MVGLLQSVAPAFSVNSTLNLGRCSLRGFPLDAGRLFKLLDGVSEENLSFSSIYFWRCCGDGDFKLLLYGTSSRSAAPRHPWAVLVQDRHTEGESNVLGCVRAFPRALFIYLLVFVLSQVKYVRCVCVFVCGVV